MLYKKNGAVSCVRSDLISDWAFYLAGVHVDKWTNPFPFITISQQAAKLRFSDGGKSISEVKTFHFAAEGLVCGGLSHFKSKDLLVHDFYIHVFQYKKSTKV